MSAQVVPGYRTQDGQSTDAIKRAVLTKLSDSSAEAKAMIQNALRGKTVGDSSEEQVAMAFDAIVPTLIETRKRQGSSERNRMLGADLLGAGPRVPVEFMKAADAESQLQGRDLWLWRLAHGRVGDAHAEEL